MAWHGLCDGMVVMDGIDGMDGMDGIQVDSIITLTLCYDFMIS